MSDANETPAYQHVHPTVLAQAVKETLARLELEDHQIRMQAVVADNPNAELGSGETIQQALQRIAASKERVERAYASLISEPTHTEEGTA